MKRIVQKTVALVALGLEVALGQARATEAKRPNVLFIAIDDLNDWVGFLDGHPQARTPNMDRLARRGVIFTNAHCTAPICGPSRAAVMTGLQPYHTGLYTNAANLTRRRTDLVTLPRFFKEHGYQVMGTGKLFHGKAPKNAFHEYGPTSDSEVPVVGLLPRKNWQPGNKIPRTAWIVDPVSSRPCCL